MDGRQCQRVAKFAELEYALIGQRQCDIESKPEKEPHWPWNAHHIGNAHIGKGKQPSVKNQVKNFLAWEQILGHDWSTGWKDEHENRTEGCQKEEVFLSRPESQQRLHTATLA
jgi:hypothetical protein